MPTFQELLKQVTEAKQRKVILEKVIEYLDEEFCPSGSELPKKTLLMDDMSKIPVEMIEAVISDTLTPEVEQLSEVINSTNATEMKADDKAEKKAKKTEKAT